MKVLIVDDSDFMRKVLIDLLSKSKWKDAEIVEASDGDEAVEKFKNDKPDLILLDILMPKKDGISVLKEIGYSATAVIIVSSVGDEKVIEEAKGLGAKDYIVKPFDARLVIDTINKFIP